MAKTLAKLSQDELASPLRDNFKRKLYMMKKILTAVLGSAILFCAVSAQAKIFRDIIVGGFTGGAAIAEGKSADEVFDSAMSAISDHWAVGSSLFKIVRSRVLREGTGGSVRFLVEKYKTEKLYDDLVDRLEGKERSALIADQKAWNKNGMKAEAQALEKNGLDRTKAYEVAMTGRYNKLMEMWKRLESGNAGQSGSSYNRSSECGNSVNFGAPHTGDQICGNVIAQATQDGHTIFVMDVRGQTIAYYSSDKSCKNSANYVCAKLQDNDETTPELMELGIDAPEVYKIANCVR